MNTVPTANGTRLVGVTTNQGDRALAAPVAERARHLLAADEDQWFDRKCAEVRTAKLAPALVAFASAEGGSVAVGLAGAGESHLSTADGQQTP